MMACIELSKPFLAYPMAYTVESNTTGIIEMSSKFTVNELFLCPHQKSGHKIPEGI